MLTGTVSVVVPTFNCSSQLTRLLDSFDRLEERIPLEVIIVDDKSTDETHKILKSWASDGHSFSPVLLRNETNHGPAKARNLGVMKASGDYVAFTDSDCIVDKRWLVEIMIPIDRDSKIVGVGGRVLPLKNDILSRFYHFHRILEPSESLLYLVTANCCYDRKAVMDVQGFDEDIRKPGGEDVALSLKLLRKGLRFTFSPSAIVYHDFKNDLRDFYRRHVRYGEGCSIVSTKYFGASR